jgi:hypothetical protein
MPSLSCCDDKLITSLKVFSESKYTDPTINVSAEASADVMNNARSRDLVNTNVAAGNDFICVNHAKGASIMRFTCITVFQDQGYRKLANVKDRIGDTPFRRYGDNNAYR